MEGLAISSPRVRVGTHELLLTFTCSQRSKHPYDRSWLLLVASAPFFLQQSVGTRVREMAQGSTCRSP